MYVYVPVYKIFIVCNTTESTEMLQYGQSCGGELLTAGDTVPVELLS
jgi:hypothetical protein